MAVGKQINNLNDLMDAVRNRKAIVVPNHPSWNFPRPASFLINVSGTTLYALFARGMYIYNKEPKNVRRKAGVNGGSAENKAYCDTNA